MRPRQIVGFELLMIVSLLLGGIEAARNWPDIVAHYASLSPSPEQIAAIVVGVTLGLVLLLTLLASRRRNAAALILLLLLFLGGLPQVVHQLMATGIDGTPTLALLALAAQLGAFAFAATESARHWFTARGVRPAPDADASDVFPG